MNIFTLLLTQPLANGLILFYKLTGGNLGLAIIIFSVLLILVMRPLTKPYMDSMKRIKDLQPLIDKLKKKYGNDKAGFTKAQAELYKQKGVNPGAGCLPYILQIVILIGLFQALSAVLTPGGGMSKINDLMYPALKFSGEQTLNTQFLYFDITKPDSFKLPGVPFALPGAVLLLATLAQFISVKITAPYISKEEKVAKKTKGEADDMQTAMSSSMTYTFPLMTLIFGLSFPSGMALYWLIFSIVNVWQQVRSSGWGSLTPLVNKAGSWLNRKGLLKSVSNNKNGK